MSAGELRLQTFGPDKILGPEHAEHVRGVVMRAISRHADLGIVVRERIADAVAETLTGKVMRPDTREEDVEECPGCKHLAEEDGDILPPACAAHDRPPKGDP